MEAELGQSEVVLKSQYRCDAYGKWEIPSKENFSPS